MARSCPARRSTAYAAIRGSAVVRPAVVVMIAVMLCGCHVKTRLAIPGASPTASAPMPAVRAGDEVRVVLRDGTVAALTVAELADDAIVSTRGQRYPLAEITQIEKRAISSGRSAAAVAAVVGGTLAAFTLLMLAFGWELDL